MNDELELTEHSPDFFGDGDLADAENLPAGVRYIGYVSKVDTSQTAAGAYRKLTSDKQIKAAAGRTEVPQVDVSFTAMANGGGVKFGDDTNFYKTSTNSYWIGKEDRIGRHSLARLIRDIAGVADEDLKTTPIRELAPKLHKCYVTFEVTHRKFQGRNGEGVAQDFTKIKPASVEEVESVQ